MSDAHLSNFLEALVFARECDIDTSTLERNASHIVADFLIVNAMAIEKYDDGEEGSATFRLGLVLSGVESKFEGDFVSLDAHARRVAKHFL